MHTKKKGVFKVGKGVLKMLKAKNAKQKKVKKLLLERSKIAKALETLRGKDGTKGIIPKVIDGLVHPQYNQTVAKTGRVDGRKLVIRYQRSFRRNDLLFECGM
jgi:hypothetical protein